ncbi:MAG TPA: DUF2520 domain-containing protein [Thermoanaerobaculia bacterium]|nr:DUF2520 domain-containing protein [Thermoanaerobaculia bacterium]
MVELPLAGLSFSLVGPGRVGRSLAQWARAAGAELSQVAGRSAGADLGGGLPRAISVGELASAGDDFVLLAVPDRTLPAVAAELARRPQAAVVLHTAGSLDAAVLAPLRQAGSAVGSFHPLKAFPRPLPDPGEARGIVFAVDGDPAARVLACRLARAWEAVPVEIPAAARPLYHLAASLAAGGAVTLLSLATELAGRLELPPEAEQAVARGYLELARGALAAADAADSDDPAQALTGPVARGDLTTVRRQLDALRHVAPEKLPLALHLARETLRQQSRLGPLGEQQQALLAEIEKLLAL